MIGSGTKLKRKRDDALYRVASCGADSMFFLTAADETGWPSLWEDAETIRRDYDLVAPPRDPSEAQVLAAQATAGTREFARAYVHERAARERLADETGLEPDELPRDRPGAWRRVLGPMDPSDVESL